MLALGLALGLCAGLALAGDEIPDPLLDLPVGRPEPDPPAPRQREWGEIRHSTDVRLPPPPPAPPPAPPKQTEPVRDVPYPVLWGEEVASLKLIVVVDMSQSMWDTPGRILALRAEFVKFLASLYPQVKFDVISFTGDPLNRPVVKVLWPRTSEPDEGLQPATDANKAQALQFVNAPTSGGSTPTYYGVKAALDFRRNDRVVLISDGMPTVGAPWEPFALDPRVYGLGVVPSIPGPGVESMFSRPPLPNGANLLGTTLDNEWMIRRENRVVRPAAGARPATIDVYGIDVEGSDWQKANAYWLCSEVARHSGGYFKPVRTP